MTVNNATRLLDSHWISCIPHTLPTANVGAPEAAQAFAIEPERVFKTIVVQCTRPGRHRLVLLPAGMVVDLEALAAAVGEKKLHLQSERGAERITCLQAGGISALAHRDRGFQVVFDSSAVQHATIRVSGGQGGLIFELAPADDVRRTGARLAAVARPDPHTVRH